MSGVKGRSGRKPMPAAWHILRGTYRPDRHGPRPGPVVVGATALQVAVPPVPKGVLAGLAAPGRELACALWERYDDWTPGQLSLLHEVGVVADTLAEYAGILAQAGKIQPTPSGREEPHPLLRLQAQAQRTLVLLLAALNLKED